MWCARDPRGRHVRLFFPALHGAARTAKPLPATRRGADQGACHVFPHRPSHEWAGRVSPGWAVHGSRAGVHLMARAQLFAARASCSSSGITLQSAVLAASAPTCLAVAVDQIAARCARQVSFQFESKAERDACVSAAQAARRPPARPLASCRYCHHRDDAWLRSSKNIVNALPAAVPAELCYWRTLTS